MDFESKTKVFIEPQPWNQTVKVWLTARWGNGKRYNYTIGENGHMKATEVEDGMEPPSPLMIIPQDMLQDIVDAFTEKVPPTKRERVEAELEATKYHLEDMRKLALKDINK